MSTLATLWMGWLFQVLERAGLNVFDDPWGSIKAPINDAQLGRLQPSCPCGKDRDCPKINPAGMCQCGDPNCDCARAREWRKGAGIG